LANPRRARLVIADDHPLVAEGIKSMLAPDYDVVGVAANGRDLLESVAKLSPDLVCLDISMPEMNGLQAAVRLSELYPKLKIVFVTQQLDLPYVKAAFRAGAAGYVCKQSASEEIHTAVKQVLSGRRFLTPLIAADQFTPEEFERNLDLVFMDRLTERQREVLQLTAAGKTIREIADVLSISTKTVEFHKNMLMNELGLRTTAELTRYAVAHRLVP
jgi:DNA-binding NarL/FixJ family response regulator